MIVGTAVVHAEPVAPPSPFAMCSNGAFLNNPEYPAVLADAGARGVRLDVAFAAVRAKPGDDPSKWDWKQMEDLRGIRRKFPAIEALPVLGYGTGWAADPKLNSPATDIAAPQRGVNVLPATDARNLFGNYVFETVRRYRDVTSVWESWNEPDLPGHAFFKGDGKDFFPYQKACYLAAKAADPHCQVLFGSMCYANVEGYLTLHHITRLSPNPPTTCFFEEFLIECAKDPDAKANHHYFDVMNQHTYSRASDAFDYIAVDRKLMTDYLGDEGRTKPVWITEMGFPDVPGIFGGTPDEYCDYVLQSFAWGKLAGVDRFFHFQLDNSNTLGLYDGMLGKPKPVLTTYRDVLCREFSDVTDVKQIHGHPGIGFVQGNSPFQPTWQTGYNAFEFHTRGGHRILMAFADTEKPVAISLPAAAARATLIDRHNHRTELQSHREAGANVYTVELSGATNVAGWPAADDATAKAMGSREHLVGGPTAVLVEDK